MGAKMNRILIATAVVFLMLGSVGCTEKKDAGDKVGDAIKKAGDKVGDAADKVIDKTEDAGEKVKDKVTK